MVENFRKLAAGRIDYFITSYYLGQAYLASQENGHEIIALAPAISKQNIHFGFSRNSACASLVDYVSHRLEELDRKGVPERLLKKHLRRFNEQSHGLFKR
ncbi:amino acid ABC transporter substrate-binding protein [Geobacter sp. FeAm09]|nr:amino acid ABC transporter substrate-binding protein [Geobacter sp. FeAm09]QEM68549.1 amino acid ABC transporter substrate-binding protein [Geobacter sp. FeAm09]